ncbi:helix-turn-helix domain-containing protein [Nitratireductor aquimarinus]|uniref:Helix-turn-helix domain-containing protein n=2 Tax=Pseudomonadota TaxID=1224 RepID=A0ABU4AFF8_9HYPH|nr:MULTISPECIES: helix-turn-helix domain-containing protein [Nitratireductor]MBN7774773.1 helix-turn-helix domain-containing protein [Nitratireductor pacificus]MBN7779634.1 helix-turn-helix domain-containing protein [Nitratireductor pacificus]MBN7788441.1 helix-turn-helix domain-containing protein [Nitratireductor aquimarinus]MBN8242880.1 helix-turn-helix domain-containing protein [Nitratireductor aquimarinus]MBY6097160.1 helix-turn-helix domain-containing protein [Nitratireductor aquimarinus]
MWSIGELSKRVGVKVPTIRYYEETGLIEPPERSSGNQRRYGKQAMERLAFIRHARDLGLGIDAIRSLIELSGHPEKPCETADSIAREHLTEVRERIARLQRLEHELQRIVDSCDSGSVCDCYVLRALSDHSLCESEH